MTRALALALLSVGPCTAGRPVPARSAQEARLENPVELGRVAFRRDHDAAFAEAGRTGRPVLILFQEIPGCATCRGFGSGPLSSPLVVEAIEGEFVPLCVQNNAGGDDARQLSRYREPAWNNPVVRFFAADGRELLEREDGVYREAPLVDRLVAALEAAGREVPGYLVVAQEEARSAGLARVAFAMHCFWEGEARLGALEGVRATRVGYVGGREVVDLRFDPHRTTIEELVGRARELGCADEAYVQDEARLAAARKVLGDHAHPWAGDPRDAAASDRRRHLRASPLRFVALTPLQEVRVNAALAAGKDPGELLSPTQRALGSAVEARLSAAPRDLAGLAWDGWTGDLWSHRRRLAEVLGEGS